MGLGDWIKGVGHGIAESARTSSRNSAIRNEEKDQLRKIFATRFRKRKNLADLCTYLDFSPPTEREVPYETDEEDVFGQPIMKTEWEEIELTREYLMEQLIENCQECTKESVLEFCETAGIQIPDSLKGSVVALPSELEGYFRRNKDIEDWEEVIFALGWSPSDVVDIQNLRERIWKKMIDGDTSEDDVLELAVEYAKGEIDGNILTSEARKGGSIKEIKDGAKKKTTSNVPVALDLNMKNKLDKISKHNGEKPAARATTYVVQGINKDMKEFDD